MKKVFSCEDCPCANSDMETGETCNLGETILNGYISNKFISYSNNCILEKIVLKDGKEIKPKILKIDEK